MCIGPLSNIINTLISMVWQKIRVLLCARLILYHWNDWSNNQIVFTKILTKYNHIQLPDAPDFFMMDAIINLFMYFIMKSIYTSVEA